MNNDKYQKILIKRIDDLCREKGLSYYELSYRSAIPLTTLVHIMDGTTKNPGFFTILKICDGLGVSLEEFVQITEFQKLER